jgi:hypothetical protein
VEREVHKPVIIKATEIVTKDLMENLKAIAGKQ